jgi:hypothetical protein
MKIGIHIHNTTPIPNIAINAPFRCWDNIATQWATMQPTANGGINTANLQALVAKFKDVLYTIGFTPTWAASNQNLGGYGFGSNSIPSSPAIVSNLVTAVVNAGITSIEPINEVTTTFGNPALPTGWTPQTIFDHQRNVYMAAKRANPNVLVLSPSMSLNDADKKAVLGLGIDAYVDVWALHCYADTSQLWFHAAEDAINTFRKLVGYSKPIWLTECGTNPTNSMGADIWEQFLRRVKYIGDIHGVDRMYLYAFENSIYGYQTAQAQAAINRANLKVDI